MKKFIEVVEAESGIVMERRDVSDKSDGTIEKIIRGMSINMADEYYARVSMDEAAA